MKFKKSLATFLAIVCAFASIPVYASENDATLEPISITEETTVHAPELEELAETLSSGSIISNINISGNTITYTINNEIEASITKRDEKGISIYTVVEDGKTDVFVINPSSNEAYINGEKLEATVTTTQIPPDAQPMADSFVYYGTQSYNVSLTTRVRYATLSAVIFAMQALIFPISVNVSNVASFCISFAQLTQSNSNDIIVLRTTYMHVNYIAYRYYDTYQIDGSTATTDTFERWE